MQPRTGPHPLPDAAPPRPCVGGYELLHRLHPGGCGEVHVGRHRAHGHLRAVKVVFPVAEAVEEAALRLYKEHVRFEDYDVLVPIEECGRAEDGRLYYVMPLADHHGPPAPLRPTEVYAPLTLDAQVELHGPMPLDDIFDVADRLLLALGRLHHYGLLHLDVKPLNVLKIEGNWRLGDFGIMALRPKARTLGLRGTPWYCPPKGPLDFNADVYALGRTLLVLASGLKPPKTGGGGADPFLELKRGRRVIRQADGRAQALRGLILRACATASARRPTVEELGEEVRRLISRTVWVGIRIPGDFGSWTAEMQRQLRRHLEAMGLTILEDGAVSGSIIYRVRLTPTQAAYLRAAVERGALAAFDASLVEPPPIPETGQVREPEALSEQPLRSLARTADAHWGVVDPDAVDSRPADDRVEVQPAEFGGPRRGWRLGALAAAAVLLLPVLGGFYLGWRDRADRQYQTWTAFCGDEGSGEADAGRRAAMAEGLLFWHGTVLSRAQKARLEQAQRLDRQIERDHGERVAWQAIEDERRRLAPLDEPQQIELLQGLVEKLEAFGARWAGVKTGEGWQAQLQTVRATLAAKLEQHERFNGVLSRGRQVPDGRPETKALIELWQEYLKSEPVPLPYYRQQAEAHLELLEIQYDRHGLNELLAEARRARYAPEQCGAFIQRARNYLRGCYRREQAEKEVMPLIAAETRKADMLVYTRAVEAVNAAREATEVKYISAARTAVEQYLRETVIPGCGERRPVVMRASAEAWVAWHDEISRGKSYPVRLDKMFVDSGHELVGILTTAAYGLRLSGAMLYDTTATDTYFETPPSATSELETSWGRKGYTVKLSGMQAARPPGSINYRLGDKLNIGVDQRFGGISWKGTFWREIKADLFVPAVLRRGWDVLDKNGKAITVFIDCEGAVVPQLAPFPGEVP